MKSYLISLVLVTAVVAVGLLTVAADDLPKAQAFARYDAMKNRSPFAVATAVVAPAPTPNFAKDLYVANAARTAEGGLVTIASSTDKNLKLYLSTQETVEGYSVPNIDWSDRVGETKVTISKDGQTATLTFNQSLLSQSVANTVPQAAPPQLPPQPQAAGVGVPPVPQYNNNANFIKPAPIPTLPTPPPRVRGVIQRNPNGAAVAQPQVEPEQQKAQDALVQDE